MFSQRKNSTIRQWLIASTVVVIVLGLIGLTIGQELRPMPDGPDRASSAMNMKVPQNAGDFKMAERWQRATDLMNKMVIHNGTYNIGMIKDIVVDPNSGRILYGILSFGAFMNMGDKLFAIPWQSLQLTRDSKAFTLNVDKDRLKNAPCFDKNHWPDFADEQWATATSKYYAQTPYWQLPVASSSAANRGQWNQRVTGWQKCSGICGKGVVDARNEDSGTLIDCIIDSDGSRVIYGVVCFRGNYFAVPWSALTLPKDAKQLALIVKKDQLKDSVSFGKDNWPNITDEQWARDTFARFKLEPYWAKTNAADHR